MLLVALKFKCLVTILITIVSFRLTSLANGSVFFRHQLPERKERNAANHEHNNSESHKVVFD